MNNDRYRNFAELKRSEREEVDYRVVAVDRRSPVTVLAPHGGYIEPPTSRLALAIAGDTFNVFCFEGLSPDREHHDLHITSENFDEPVACGLVSRSEIVVALHGRLDRDDPHAVWLGGLDRALRDRIAAALRDVGIAALTEGHLFPGIGARNICNSGRRGMGVQLELPRTLRDVLVHDALHFNRFVQAVRLALPTTAK
jgi:phage replication-related protein YjqB (UPF0714/DUF867 family)